MTTFVRCRIQANSPGQVKLKIHGTDGLLLWIDGTTKSVAEVTDFDSPAGKVTVSLNVNQSRPMQSVAPTAKLSPGWL